MRKIINWLKKIYTFFGTINIDLYLFYVYLLVLVVPMLFEMGETKPAYEVDWMLVFTGLLTLLVTFGLGYGAARYRFTKKQKESERQK